MTKKIAYSIDLLIFIALIVFCSGYGYYHSYFAEVNIQLPFLDFPIFVGEWLLGISLLLLLIKWKLTEAPRGPWAYAIGVYLVWLVLRAFWGYFTYGPLAFRSAALFYYPLFVLIGYHVYRKEFFNQTTIISGIVAILLLKAVKHMGMYASFAYILSVLVLLLKVHNKWVKYFLLAALIYLFPLNALISDSRSYVVGKLVAVVFILSFLFWGWVRLSFQKKLILVAVSSLIVVGSFLVFIGKNRDKYLLSVPRLANEFKQLDAMVQEGKMHYRPENIPAQLFNKSINITDHDVKVKNSLKNVAYSLKQSNKQLMKEIDNSFEVAVPVTGGKEAVLKIMDEAKEITKRNMQGQVDLLVAEAEEWLKVKPDNESYSEDLMKRKALKQRSDQIVFDLRQKILQEKENLIEKAEKDHHLSAEAIALLENQLSDHIQKVMASIEKQAVTFIDRSELGGRREVNIDYGNVMFRVLIWRDMFKELLSENVLFGVNWGKPQRSISLEILGYGTGEWSRDGWIAPHNSYFHVIYRAGMVGLFLIVFAFIILKKMVVDFMQYKSLIGGLLVGILINGFTIANFLVFMELPYHAIPFWTVFGLTLAYAHSQRKQSIPNFKESVKYAMAK